MQRKYFGTDGIRGRVGEFPVVPEFALKLGYAVGKVLAKEGKNLVVIGQDTRRSGFMFSSALASGFSAAGMDVMNVGIMPTPAVAYLTKWYNAQVGVVVSASHNPAYDNGIKFFSEEGEKLPDEIELAIEQAIESELDLASPNRIGSYRDKHDAERLYTEFCIDSVSEGLDLSQLKIIVDCAHGAMYKVAPVVLQSLGAEVIQICAAPDGDNINAECGAVHTKKLQEMVIANLADVGIAFDGDGDRLMIVDASGRVVDGDEILYLIARDMKAKGTWSGGVVGTVMTNLGVEKAFEALGVPFVRAQVGDRYVLEEMKKRDWMLGGEASGHVICYDVGTTGDGLVAALRVLQSMHASRDILRNLGAEIKRSPQCMINVPLANKITSEDVDLLKDDVVEVEKRLGQNGRVVLRPSGTEPLLRVMVEAFDEKVAEVEANFLVGKVKQKIK